jgi:hypothetical protein
MQLPRLAAMLALGLLACACTIAPRDETPGFGIRGEPTREPVADWSFTEEIEEIQIQTRTWYGIPHSVTIWCVAIDGELYVGASFPDYPDERQWVSNVKRDPRVRLAIAGRIYERRLEPIDDPARTDLIDRAFGRKYHYDVDEDPDPVAYWRVVAAE